MADHVCNLCGWKFSRKSNLKQHLTNRKNPCNGSSLKSATFHDSVFGNDGSAAPAQWGGESVNHTSKVLPPRSLPQDVEVPRTEKRNPKVQALLDEIVNDGITYFEKKSDVPAPTTKKLKLENFENETLPVISKKFPSIKPPPVPAPSRTKESLVDYSDTDDEESASDYSDDGTIDISDLPPPDKVKFLPATITGLRARFEEVLKHIAVNRKSGEHEKAGDRNEAVFLLDELKRQGGIGERMYRQYNDFLAESLPVSAKTDQEEAAMESEDEEEDQLKKEITSTADYLIEHDKKELMEIVAERMITS